MCSRVAFFRAPLLEEKQAFLSPWWARHLGPARAREKSILLPYICASVHQLYMQTQYLANAFG